MVARDSSRRLGISQEFQEDRPKYEYYRTVSSF